MKKLIKEFLPIILISLIPTLLVWLPFFLRIRAFWSIPLPQNGMATLVSNYDGPLFMVIAKSLYQADIIKSFQFTLPVEYYPAHFPLFPILIRIFSYFLGLPYAMLSVTLLSSILATYFFHKLITTYLEKNQALWLTLIFSIFPARWLIVRSVGSSEPLFVAGIIASIYYFKQKKYLLAGIWGALAQLTKSPGILLFISYFAYLSIPYIKNVAKTTFLNWLKSLDLKRYLPLLLIPVFLLAIFVFYKLTVNDFWAYFHSGDNIHLFFPPFKIFNYSAPWVGTFWLEEIIFVYLFGALGLVKLIQQKEGAISWFVAIFFVSTLFVSHRDLIRYSLPIVPFILIAFKDSLIKKEFKYVLALLVIPIYLFSLAYISQNVMPIADWSPFL